jgi:murein DD-endopeptidase MepM/ murein hydrolase activator NlpD
MPAHGQHRKPRRASRRLTRFYVAAGTGGAALALPLLSATHAAAAAPAKSAPASEPVKFAPAKAPSTTSASAGTARTYDVVHGDTLAGIARTHHEAGGWQRLYADNKSVIGSDPDMIRPGRHLTLGGGGIAHPLAKTASTASLKNAAVKTASVTTAATAASAGWGKPVGDASIGTGYHVAGSNWSSGYHTGVDFLVGTGTAVHSVAAGTVVSAGSDGSYGSYGNDVILKHADGKYTLYGHLSQALVSAGQSVTEGQQIGVSGATGNVTGPHLHFEVRTTPSYGSDIDPVAYLRSHGVSI